GEEPSIFLEPLNLYEPASSSDQHVTYRSDDVVARQAEDDDTGAEAAAVQPVTQRFASVETRKKPQGMVAAATSVVRKTVRVKVVEDRKDARQTRLRRQTLLTAGAAIKSAVRNATPRSSSGPAIPVDRFVVSSWASLSLAGYPATCDDILQKFWDDH